MTEKVYIGTKIVAAAPMTDLEFAERHVGHPRLNLLTEEPNPGYCVRYEDGYISWSPKEVFERCYREVSGREQMLVMFGGTEWPPEMVEKFKINKIGGPKLPSVNHIRENLGKTIPELEWPEGVHDAVSEYEKSQEKKP